MSYDKERILILIKTIKKMENKVKVWLARDENGRAYIYEDKPSKDIIYGEWISNSHGIFKKKFLSVKWEDDEPTEAYITLAEPQEQPKQEQPTLKQEIDWEQRRYEIAKAMMPVLYRQGVEVLKYGQSFEWKGIVDGAVNFADMLIEKLKKGE